MTHFSDYATLSTKHKKRKRMKGCILPHEADLSITKIYKDITLIPKVD